MLLFLARAMCSNSIFQPKRQNWGKNGALLCTPRWVFLPISDGWLSSLAAAHMLKNEGLNIKKKIHNHVIAQAVEQDHSRANTQEDCKKEGTRALSWKKRQNRNGLPFSPQESTESLTNLHTSPVRGSHGDLSVRSDSSSPMTLDSGYEVYSMNLASLF